MSTDDLGFEHATRRVNGDVGIHYVTAGSGPALLLIHGWGSTWYMWRELIPSLAERFTVIAPDLRGIGDSSKPASGYDKLTLATDLVALTSELGFDQVSVVAHDWGGPVGYLYTTTAGGNVNRLVMIETALPGVEYEFDVRLSGELWHNAFHAVPDLPEHLIAGRERLYLRWFYENNSYSRSAIDPAAVDEYVRCYSGPGALRASLEWYRTGAADAEAVAAAAKDRLTIPVLALGGDSCLGRTAENSMRAVADDVSGAILERCGHWAPEERPEEVLRHLDRFLET